MERSAQEPREISDQAAIEAMSGWNTALASLYYAGVEPGGEVPHIRAVLASSAVSYSWRVAIRLAIGEALIEGMKAMKDLREGGKGKVGGQVGEILLGMDVVTALGAREFVEKVKDVGGAL